MFCHENINKKYKFWVSIYKSITLFVFWDDTKFSLKASQNENQEAETEFYTWFRKYSRVPQLDSSRAEKNNQKLVYGDFEVKILVCFRDARL